MTKEVPTAASGVLLGRYRIQSEVGRGGMGVVYGCMDEALGRRVAVKTLSVGLLGRDREARMMRFQREVKALSQLDHPGILHIYDAGEAEDPVVGWVLYYAMELIEGETLSERLIRCGALDYGAAAAVVAKCAEALGAAHERGIVHRDVKPANVFLAARGRVVVADFGVCKIEGGSDITRKDQMVGTPSYLAPEQILGLPVDARTDVFALGALLYVLATNSALRPQLDRAGLSRLAATDDAANRAMAIKNAPPGLPEALARSLARVPTDRHLDGVALAEALEVFATRVPEPFEAAGATVSVPVASLRNHSTSSTPSSGAFTDLPATTLTSGPPGDMSGDGSGPVLQDSSTPAEQPSSLPDLDADTSVESELTPALVPLPVPLPPRDPLPSGRERVEGSRPREVMVRPAMTPQPGSSRLSSSNLKRIAVAESGGGRPIPAAQESADPTRPRGALVTPQHHHVTSPLPAGADAHTPTDRNPAPMLHPPTWLAHLFQGVPYSPVSLPRTLLLVALVVVGLAVPAVWVVHPFSLGGTGAVPPLCRTGPHSVPADRAEVRTLLIRATQLEQSGDLRGALPFWEKATVLAPADWHAHLGMGRCLKRLGEVERATAHFECVMALAPEDAVEAAEAPAAATGRAP